MLILTKYLHFGVNFFKCYFIVRPALQSCIIDVTRTGGPGSGRSLSVALLSSAGRERTSCHCRRGLPTRWLERRERRSNHCPRCLRSSSRLDRGRWPLRCCCRDRDQRRWRRGPRAWDRRSVVSG